MGIAAVVGMLGLWIAAAPFVPMSVDGRFWNGVIVGLIVINVALMLENNRDWGRLLTFAVGIWVCMSGFIPKFMVGRAMTTSDLVAGMLLVVAALEAIRYYRHEGPVPIDGDVG